MGSRECLKVGGRERGLRRDKGRGAMLFAYGGGKGRANTGEELLGVRLGEEDEGN